MNKTLYIILIILSLGLIIVSFLHIPILTALGVDVFALRGILILTAIPIVAICSVPFALLITIYDFNGKKRNIKKQNRH